MKKSTQENCTVSNPASHNCHRHKNFRCGWVPMVLLALGAACLVPNTTAADPDNLAASGTGILGRKESLDAGPETEIPVFNSGTAENINDGNLATRVDTYGAAGTVSFVGILWDQPLDKSVVYLDLTLALFSNGGWFGVNDIGPVPGGPLTDEHLVEPRVEITTDGGATWTIAPHSSDYLTKLTGKGIGGGSNPNPNPVTATFTLTPPAQNINGVRIIGTHGGTVSGGFLGVFDLAVRTAAFADSDNDGMDDAWETEHGLNVGTNDAAADPDADGLSNLQEFTLKTDPKTADSDGDGLKDGDEVNTHHTDPLRADTDTDGLNDGDEINTHHTNPLRVDTDGDGVSDKDEIVTYLTNPQSKDTDGDGFLDGVEISEGSDPNKPGNIPTNVASLGTGILGTKSDFESGPEGETPIFNSGVAANINDNNLATRVDTYGGVPALSFVGIVWDKPVPKPITKLELTLALFSNGGWFGPNAIDPGAGGKLTAEHLIVPVVEITTNGTDWTRVDSTSDYLSVLTDHGIGGGAFPNPNPAKVTFTLAQPAANITGIRIIGEDGGSAGGGFLGVFELATRTAAADSDNDGMDDAWEAIHGLIVGTNDASGDPDADGLTNLQEFTAQTDPQNADSDGDFLKDGDEVNTSHTNPLRADTDGDGLTDGLEVTTHHTNPLAKDTDSDGFSDSVEVAEGSDPNLASSVPTNIAPLGKGILGTKPDLESGSETEVPVFNSGSADNINDDNLRTRVDTYSGPPALSYVGILWTEPVTKEIVDLGLTLALFSNGGWFGPNGTDPGPGGNLGAEHLVEPVVEVTTDGGLSWSAVDHASDYLTVMTGHGIGGGANPNPNPAVVKFTLAQPATGISGIRIIGEDGGTAGGGFLGVYELAVDVKGTVTPTGVKLSNVSQSGGQIHFGFDSKNGTSYVVQFKNSLADVTWQTLTTITGDGSTKSVTDTITGGQRFYRVVNP
jgi:hypothetical protein